MAAKDQVSDAKVRDKILMEAAEPALGCVRYKTILKRTKGNDGSWRVRIDVYEKDARPSRKHAALLKKYGVEAKLHKRS